MYIIPFLGNVDPSTDKLQGTINTSRQRRVVDEPESTLGKILHVRIHVFLSHINLTVTLNKTDESFSEMYVKRQPIVTSVKYENIGFIYLSAKSKEASLPDGFIENRI